MKKTTKIAVKESTTRLRLLNFRVTEEQYAEIAAKAEEFFRGNLSGWVRYAAERHVPRRRDIITSKKQK